MDINDLRSAVTLASLILFVALVARAWLPRRRAEHEQAAQLPFTGDDEPLSAIRVSRSRSLPPGGTGPGPKGAR